MIDTTDLTIGYRQGHQTKTIQTRLNLHAGQGTFVALLGPNGCGKSTLIRTLGGLLPTVSGIITHGGSDLETLTLKERATRFSLVLTDAVQVKYMSVYQLVSMGRHPYTTYYGQLSDSDKQFVQQALEAVHMADFAERPFLELSDGERQRVMIAKALAQQTPVILLDEPTTYLDLPNRIETMMLLKQLTVDAGKTILVSTHEIDLAIRLADHVWLLNKSGLAEMGTPNELIHRGVIQSTFASKSFGFEPETGRVIIF
jgi:iron complex transport system ATP-binding protein